MARKFRRQRGMHPISELNVTNLIDLGFILLVIFMIATPLIQQEQTTPVNLPVVAKAPQQKADPDDVFAAVGADARGFYVDNESTPLTLEQLRAALAAHAAKPKQPVIRIKGDANVAYQKVAELLAEVQRAGLTRITFDTRPQD